MCAQLLPFFIILIVVSDTPYSFARECPVSPEFDRVVTESIRERVADFTSPGGATMTM